MGTISHSWRQRTCICNTAWKRSKTSPVYQPQCGWTSVEVDIFTCSKGRPAGSVCVSLTVPEVKRCLSRFVSHSRGLPQLSPTKGHLPSLSEVTHLCKQLPSPIPWQGLWYTILSIFCLSAVAAQQGKQKGGGWKGQECCHRKEKRKPRWDQVHNEAVANNYKCDCPDNPLTRVTAQEGLFLSPPFFISATVLEQNPITSKAGPQQRVSFPVKTADIL